MVDGLSAYKKPKTRAYYENYDRVFGRRHQTRVHKVIQPVEGTRSKSDMDKPKPGLKTETYRF
jgi:hypothetical protein